MKIRNLSAVACAVALVTILMSGTADAGMAQTPKPSSQKPPMHQGGKNAKADMPTMVGGPHHVLAMAYRDNLANFARALRGDVARSKTVVADLARPAISEMRRSFEQLQLHAQAAMAGSADSVMSARMQHLESHMAALGQHLTALETEVNGSAPDPAAVTAHTTEILKQCAEMSAMPAKGKPHQMK